MDTEKDLKYAVSWSRMNLQVFGIWPEPLAFQDNRFANCRYLVANLIITCFLLAPQSVNLVLIWGDIDLVTENLAAANIPVINTLMKMFFIWYHKEDFRSLMVSFVEDWRSCKSMDDLQTMQKGASMARKISISCMILTQTMILIFVTVRMIDVSELDRNQTSPDRMVPYTGYFPYNIRKSPAFELTVVAQTLTALYDGASYTAVDSFISMLVIHTCSQFENLRRTLTQLFDEKGNAKTQKDFQEKLTWIVKRHDHLNWFAKTVEDCCNILLLGQMLTCTVQLCFQGFQAYRVILATEGLPILQPIFFVFFVLFVGVHLFLYCYVGEMLIVQSTGLSGSAYESKWYNVPAKEAETLLIIMMRTTTPLRLTAGKFGTFSLEMFSSILRTAIGYMSVLLTVTN